MYRLMGFAALLVGVSSTTILAAAGPPAGFTVTTDAATGGKMIVSANGKLVYPEMDYDVIGAELRFGSSGGQVPNAVIIVNYGKGTWSVKNNPVNKSGTFDVYAVFTFKKKNAKVGDPSFDVPSTPFPGVVITQ